MYIGLHHAPKEKLDSFIASIKRILRPGGTFILMDHDAYTIELQNFVNVVHSIFNAATSVEPEINNQEIRNFHSLQYWINLLQSHGMIHYTHDPLIRNGDSTLNSLVRLDKPVTESTQKTIAESLILDPDYNRPQIFVGTGMTIEYTLKGLVSAPMSYFYGSEAMKEAETTHLIIRDQENIIETIDPSIVVLETYPEHSLKHVEIPRYMRFTEIMLQIAKKSCITCINISGHDKIQIDVKSPKGIVQLYAGTQAIYEIPVPTDLKYTYMALEVDVDQLCEVIRTLEKDNVEVLFIHDY